MYPNCIGTEKLKRVAEKRVERGKGGEGRKI
jgi:hypothetical protein